jgi:1,2-diacylglycerol 3-alpha-glucosyltransferase
MKNVRHIALLSPGFAAHNEDFNCIPPLQNYVPELQAHFPDLTISVIALQYPYQEGEYTWRGRAIYSAGGANRRWAKPLTWSRARRRFAQLHRKQPVDLIHSFWLREASWLGQGLSRRHRIPLVATIMGQDAAPKNRYLKRLNFDQFTVTAISKRAADRFEASSGASVREVIPWGVEKTGIPAHAERPIDVLGVGSLVPVKHWARFVRTVARVAEYRPQLRAVLVGEGPERAAIEGLIRDLELGSHLELRGELSRPEVLELMGRSKVLLHTARYEGQGYIFPEALHAGAHIVSTPVGMAEESEKWAVRPDTVQLGQAVENFLHHPVDTHPRPVWNISQTVEAYAELYASLV